MPFPISRLIPNSFGKRLIGPALSYPSGHPDEALAIDALADEINLEPLFGLLADQSVLKVFHAARQDVEIFVNLCAVPTPLFDTQIAAMVCGYGDSVGYERLVRDIAKKSIDKTMRLPTGPGCKNRSISTRRRDPSGKIYTG